MTGLFPRIAIPTILALSVVSVGIADDAAPSTPPVLLQMIRDTSVHEELGVNANQRLKISDVLRVVDGPWFRARILPPSKQQPEIRRLTDQLQKQLVTILDDQQLERLRQLERQALGTRMVLRADVSNALMLSSQQQAALRTLFQETDSKSADLHKQIREGKQSASAANRELARLKEQEREQWRSTLTSEQSAKIGQLTGEAFNFRDVRRTYPLAPELESAGVSWVQGGPVTLEQFRGKVVALHFYAFQCINCKRNLPHYDGWFDDYPEEDFVVIGIQTPETPSERSLERVTAAAKSQGIKYPVLLDSQESNWKAWSNTMWPTVYLIDKKGFIRRWWQGELNWQGNNGEEQFRQSIELLLAEND